VAFAQTQHTFAAKGVEAGTTATVVLQTGWLVTCANVGDSLGFVDHGNEVGQARTRARPAGGPPPRDGPASNAGGCIGACRPSCVSRRAWLESQAQVM